MIIERSKPTIKVKYRESRTNFAFQSLEYERLAHLYGGKYVSVSNVNMNHVLLIEKDKKNTLEEMLQYVPKFTNSILLSVQKKGIAFHLFRKLQSDNVTSEFHYTVTKNILFNEKRAKFLETGVVPLYNHQTVEDLFKFIFKRIDFYTFNNNQHSDKKTSEILDKLCLSQDFIPSFMTLDIDDKYFQEINPNTLIPDWFDYKQFYCTLSLNSYKTEIVIKQEHMIKFQYEINKEKEPTTDNLIDFLKERESNDEIVYSDGFFRKYYQDYVSREQIFSINTFQEINGHKFYYDKQYRDVNEHDELIQLIRQSIQNLSAINDFSFHNELV